MNRVACLALLFALFAAAGPDKIELRYRMRMSAAQLDRKAEVAKETIAALERRLQQWEPEIALEGDDTLVIHAEPGKDVDAATIAKVIERRNFVEFRFFAQAESGVVDLPAERKKLIDCLMRREADPKAPGPESLTVHVRDGFELRWVRWSNEFQDPKPLVETWELLEFDSSATFDSRDLLRSFPTNDESSYLALGFQMRSERAKAFGDFTESGVHRLMGVVLDGEVITAPMMNGRIEEYGIIMGGPRGFTQDQVITLAHTLAAPLPLTLAKID